jgi:hypothetical protein
MGPYLRNPFGMLRGAVMPEDHALNYFCSFALLSVSLSREGTEISLGGQPFESRG